MEFSKTILRRVYIDVSITDYMLQDVYLYEIEYKSDKTFRTNEVIIAGPRPEEKDEEDGSVTAIPTEEVDLREEFLEHVIGYRISEVPTEYYAVNAREVMLNLIEPLKLSNPKAKRLFNEIARECMPAEWLTDCLSMVRVIPMTIFDEKPEFSMPVRRRLKEKFHEVANEIKREKLTHIFARYEQLPSGPELSFTVTDSLMSVLEDVRLHGRISDDVMVSKACEIIKRYPEADIITDRTSIRLFTLFKNASMFVADDVNAVVYSMNSMLTALGKKSIEATPVNFRDYIKNAEEVRFGRYEDDVIYSIHTFRLPVSYNSEAAWKKNFSGNTMWKKVSDDGLAYSLIGDTEYNKSRGKNKTKLPQPQELFGKISVEKNDERFVLKVNKVNVRKFLSGYAVITIEAENHFYPGRNDIDRINELCSSLWSSKYIGDKYPDILNLQIRDNDKTYALSAVQRTSDGNEPWVGLLLTMGRKKKNSGNGRFVTTTLSPRMFASTDDGSLKREENASDEAICKSLIKSEYLLQLEMFLAAVIEPGSKGIGNLSSGQKRLIKKINKAFAYMVASYCYTEEQGEYAGVYRHVDKVRKIRETEDRIERKLNILYE